VVHCEIFFFREFNHINSSRKSCIHGRWEKEGKGGVGGSEGGLRSFDNCGDLLLFCCLLLYWICCWSPVQPDILLVKYAIEECWGFFKRQESPKHYMLEKNSSCSYLIVYICGKKPIQSSAFMFIVNPN